jgi:hypothetical protein
MFAVKIEAYLSESPFRCPTVEEAPDLTHKHLTRLEMLARSKHSSLSPKFVNYGQESFATLGPG